MPQKKARYICFEGTEGVGKTTQTQLLVDTLKARGHAVLLTKEPGTPLIPLTMMLRGIMLDNQYDEVLTRPARELISQAIRSIHLERLIVPGLDKYDYIVQDRGILSGYAYGTSCGNDFLFLKALTSALAISAGFDGFHPEKIYDDVVYLRGDSKKNLARAKTVKQEFAQGDAMESRGDTFMEKTASTMDTLIKFFNGITIDVGTKPIEEVNGEIMRALNLTV
jgi:dTMP kinase